jgi:hypothetical protein
MATNMDAALYAPPQGLEDAGMDEEAIEIEVIDPDEPTEKKVSLILDI